MESYITQRQATCGCPFTHTHTYTHRRTGALGRGMLHRGQAASDSSNINHNNIQSHEGSNQVWIFGLCLANHSAASVAADVAASFKCAPYTTWTNSLYTSTHFGSFSIDKSR